MAVSGCKSSDFSGSLSCGSAEDIDHFCEPCLTAGQKVDAQKYCVDCGEYLCRTCSDYHLRSKASRNHQLVDKDKVGKQPTTKDSDVCTEKCPEHQQEVIKYFCPQHDNLGCHVCMIMHHKTCEVDYIPQKCKGILNIEEYRMTVQQLDLKLQELNEITKITKVRDQDIDKCHRNLLQEIIRFRKEINDYLDQLQQKIQTEADKKKAEDKLIIQRILVGCIHLSSDIKKMQSTMQVNETSGRYGDLYIKVKQAQSVLRSDEIKAEEGLERTAQQYIFEGNSFLINMLSMQDTLGKLSLTYVLNTSRNMSTFEKLIKKGHINVGTNSDQEKCWISGCAVLSSNKVVLADNFNKKLKLVNMSTKTVVETKSLDSFPFDVAVLSQDKIAVTMPDKREVVIMTCDDRLSTVDTISVSGICRGITHHHGQLYVVFVHPACVRILDKQGTVQKKIYLSKETFLEPRYLVVSDDSKLFYISERGKDSIVSITLQGEVTAVYKHTNLVRPRGMLMLEDGSLLVCCWKNGTIHHILGDLKQCKTVIDGLEFPNSICYNHHLHEVYVGNGCNQLTVFVPE